MPMQISPKDVPQLTLWYLLQHSVTSFHKLIEYCGDAQSAIDKTALPKWQKLKLHANHIERFNQFHTPQGKEEFSKLLKTIEETTDHILIRGEESYPSSLLPYEDSPPILFIQGHIEVFDRPQIAMVGSRNTSPHGAQIAYDFAHYFAENNYVVTSGLAIGIDAACHHGAIHCGQTIAIIATGLDQCYPKENKTLWQDIVRTGGAIVTEFLPNTAPRKQYFPRRNRIISGLSLGTIVVEAGLNSGSLITAKSAIDQGKSVFAIPGHIYSQFHQGCHQLIRDGATLVDHPTQVLEDLTLFTHVINASDQTIKSTKKIVSQATSVSETSTLQQISIPEHLQSIYEHLDWVGISIDELAIRLNQHISELTIGLVELELLGLCKQHAGRYLKC